MEDMLPHEKSHISPDADDQLLARTRRSASLVRETVPGAVDVRVCHTKQLVYMLLILAAVNVFNYMDRMALAVLAPLIQIDLKLSDAQLGLLVGVAFSLFYAVCGIPIARCADRGVRRDLIAVSLAVWSLMTALSGAAQNFWHLFLARVGVGAGEAGCLPAGHSMICDYVPLSRRAGFFAIHSLGLVGGMLLGLALAGWLGEAIGWRGTFVALGVPGIALAVIVRLSLREPRRGTYDLRETNEVDASVGEGLRTLWHCRTYRLIVIFLATSAYNQQGLYPWWPSFYVRVFGLPLSSVGIYLGVAIGLGQGAGLLLGGLLANKVAARDVRLPLRIGAFVTLLALPSLFGSLLVSSQFISFVLGWLTVFLWSVPGGTVLAALYSVVRPQMRAIAGAASAFCTAAIGLSLGPLCVGVLSDLLTPLYGPSALRYALMTPVCFLPVVVAILLAAAKELPRDLKAIAPSLDT